MNKNKLQDYGLKLFVLFSFFLGTLLFFQLYVDDSFIFFRYGYNLIHHGIWSWSTEGQPAEAYTSFVYAVLSIFPPLLNIPPHVFIKLVGLVILISFLFRIYTGTKGKRWALITVVLVVSNWQIYAHAYSGLETLLWSWLMLESFFILREEEVPLRLQIRLWLICFLMTLNRPEGAIYAAFFFLYLKFYKKQKINYGVIVAVAIVGIIYFIARYKYFGLLFPLPFYHKLMDKHISGSALFIYNLYTSWHYILCAAMVLYFFRKNKLVLFLGALTFIVYIGLYSKAFLVMNYADRFPFQLFYPFLIFALIQLEKEEYFNKVKILLVIFFLNLIILSKGLYDYNYIELASIPNNAGSAFFVPRAQYIPAKHINKIPNVEDKKIKILFGDAGVFAYYVKAEVYDYNGLTNPYFATHPLTEESLLQIQADVVMIGSAGAFKEELNHDPTNCGIMYKIMENHPEFRYIGNTICKENGYYVHIYINSKSPNATVLEAALKDAVEESHTVQLNVKRFLKFKYLNMENI